MSDLLNSLGLAARALTATRYALDVTGHNIANVNTPGYARRVVDFAAVPPYETNSAGGGVDVVRVRALRDLFVEQRLRQEIPGQEREAAVAASLSVVEAVIGRPGAGLDADLAAFFDAFSLLADDPTSPTARQEVVLTGQTLAGRFQDLSASLVAARRHADQTIRGAVEEVNALATEVARLNHAIGQAGAESDVGVQLRSEMVEVLNELSKLIDISTVTRGDGGLDVTVGNGRPLVIGPSAFALQAVAAGPEGLATLRIEGTDLTAEVTAGRIGGLLHVRDVALPDYLTRLDTLAYELVDEVNTLHDAGFDLDGNDAGRFFAALGGSAGAAAAIAVDAGTVANHRTIAAAGAASPGNNQTAQAIAALRDARVLDGGLSTLADGYAQFVQRVGRDSRAAQQESESRRDVVLQIQNLRDAVSAVSLDEEAVMMVKFQRAYEANARFFQTIDQLLDVLLQLGAR